MRTSEERVAELHRRMRERRIARFRIISIGMSAACLALVTLFSVYISRLPVWDPNAASGGITASIFANHSALSLAVVAIAAFCLGAMVTVLCYRLRQHMMDEERRDD